ncbi:MAG: hypothetical protein ACRDNS_06975, partial [Trebonia sp.]
MSIRALAFAVVVFLSAVSVAAAAGSGPQPARTVRCHPTHLRRAYGRIPLRAEGVRCRFAAQLAADWNRRRLRSPNGPCEWRDG